MPTVYVVIVCNSKNFGQGCQHAQSFTGTDKESLVRKAFEIRKEWESKGSGNYYDIYVGTITHKAVVPVAYTLVELENL